MDSVLSNNYFRRDNCRLCGSKNIELSFSLEPTPPANAFLAKTEINKEEEKFPLDVFFCKDCAHVQLLDVVNPSILFENYVYVSGTSPVFVEHFRQYSESMFQDYGVKKEGAFVVEIGSNDGTLLNFFQQAGARVVGIDPAKDIAKKATERGIKTLPLFFSPDIADELAQEYGKTDLVLANNVFAHIDDLDAVTLGIKKLLKEDGIFVFEVSYLKDVFEKTLFDTIYHEHLCYHSVKPLQTFFEKHGMELIGAHSVNSHGGSLRAVAQLKGGPRKVQPSVAEFITEEAKLGLHSIETFKKFAADIDSLGKELRGMLEQLKSEGKKIAAFGAPAKATTLMHHFKISDDVIDFIVDDSPLKQNLYSPGYHLPVVSSAEIKEQKPDYLVVLAWNFADPIMEKNKYFLEQGGHFIVPLPSMRVV